MLADIAELEDYQVQEEHENTSVPTIRNANRPPHQRLQELPFDLLLRILCKLDAQALSLLRQTCHSMHRATSNDRLWSRLSEHLGTGQEPEEPALDGLRWLSGASGGGTVIVRSNRATARLQQMQMLRSRFQRVAQAELVDAGSGLAALPGMELYLTRHLHAADRLDAKLLSLWRSHVSMRAALCHTWLGIPDVEVAWLQRVILQLTRLSWSHCYEALVCCFNQICDAISLGLQSRATDAQLWPSILAKWHKYWWWLERTVAACEALCGCVSAERTAEWIARGRPDTPSVLDSGKLAFRSQVLLCLGLRARLQGELLQLSTADLQWQRVAALLKLLDVADDGTADAVYHTQERLREAFALDCRGF